MLKITKNQGSIQVTADKSGFYPFDGTITFPTNSLFTATSANTDMITFKSTSNGDVQFVGNYKDITISGRSYDTKQKFLTAFSNLANQGSVDAYTKAETDAKIDAKQGKLKAGDGITLTEDATDGTTVVKTKLSMNRGPFNDDGIKIGRAAKLETSTGIAFGDESLSKNGGIAIGNKAQSWGMSSIVIGKDSSDKTGSSAGSSIVIGNGAHGGSAGAVIGTGAHGGSAGAVIGSNSTVDGNGYGYAIGDNVHISETTNMVPIAIGFGAEADETKPLAITILKVSDTDSDGTPEMKYCDFIQGDANGKISLLKGDGTDERMVIQDEIEALKNAGGSGGSANPMVNVKGTGSATIPDDVTDAVAIGSGASASKSHGVSVGYNCKSGESSVTIGNKSFSSSGSVAIGVAQSLDGSIGIGMSAYASGTKSIAVGFRANAGGTNCVAIGRNSSATTDMPLVIKAGVDGNGAELPMIQGASTGKISIPIGDGTTSTMCLQDEIAALKNAGGSGGSSNPLVNVKGTDSATITDTVTDAVAIGSGAKVTEELSVAIGAANALSGHCVAIGSGANAAKMSSVAIGDGAIAQAHMFDVAIGFHAATTDTKPLEINAGYKTVGGATTPLTVLQSDSNGKLSILKGDDSDERIVISDEITALKAEITTLKAEIAALKGGASTGA